MPVRAAIGEPHLERNRPTMALVDADLVEAETLGQVPLDDLERVVDPHQDPSVREPNEAEEEHEGHEEEHEKPGDAGLEERDERSEEHAEHGTAHDRTVPERQVRDRDLALEPHTDAALRGI